MSSFFCKKTISLLFFLLLLLVPVQSLPSDTKEISQSSEYIRYEKISNHIKEQDKALIELEKSSKKTFLDRYNKYSSILDKLAQISKSLSKKNDNKILSENYKYVVELWRSFVEDSFVNISGSVIERNLPEIVTFEEFSPSSDLSQKKIEDLNKKYIKLKQDYRKYVHNFDIALEKDNLYYNKILLNSGKLRSKIYQRLKKEEGVYVYELSNENFHDLWREVRIIPLRWTATFYSKILEFRDHLNAGPVGYMIILKEVSLLATIILFVIVFVWFYRRMVDSFEGAAETYLRKAYRSNLHWFLQYLLSLINKIIPLLVLQFGLLLIERIIETTTINELAELVPYVEYYILYRMVVVVSSYSVTKLKANNQIHINYQSHSKLLKSFTSFYRFILINMMVLHSINTIVGEAMIYGIYNNIYIATLIIYSLYLVDLWRLEIFKYKLTNLDKKAAKTLKTHFKRFYAPITSYIIFILIIIAKIYNMLLIWLDQFDLSKKISAKIFQAQIKKASAQFIHQRFYNIPESYIQKFSSTEPISKFLVEPNEFINCRQNIENWLNGRGLSNNILLYGAAGSGKTTLINSLDKYFNSKIYKHINLNTKIVDFTSLVDVLNKALGLKSKNLESLISELQQIKQKTIIAIDNAHNLFLSSPNGFDSIKSFLTIINSKIENVFWVVSFHSFAWDHISRILESSQSFDTKLELESWSSKEIEDLIMNRHREAYYEISFDDIFFALEKEHIKDTIDYMKNKFFRLLWEQSDGNPARAMSLWISSLRFDGYNTLHVSLPTEFDSSNILNLGSDLLFVCAAILRHEFLSIEQLAEVTNQEKSAISYMVKTCIKKKILIQDKNSNLRINPEFSSDIIRILKRKNYVY